MAQQITLPHNFTPRHYQLPFCKATEKYKRIMAIWHRRAGKDKTFFSMLAKKAFERVGVYFYCFPTAKQGRKVIWDNIDSNGIKFRRCIPDAIVRKENNTEMKIELINGSIIQIIGSDNYDDTLVGTNPVGIIFSEYSLQKPDVWDYCRPILRENGGWAWFNGTPRGKNHMYRQLQAGRANPDTWFTEVLDIDATGVLTPEDVAQDISEGMSESRAQQEYYLSFDAEDSGVIYSRELNQAYKEKRVSRFLYDPDYELYTHWDIGINDAMCIVFFQMIGNSPTVIDYYEDIDRGMEWYKTDILDRYSKEKGYKYKEHFAPHDIKVRETMSQDEQGFALTRLESAKKFGLYFTRCERIDRVETRIEITRGMFRRVCINAQATRVLDGLSNYRRRKNDNMSNEKYEHFDKKPLHDWASNPADAFGGMCVLIKQGMIGKGTAIQQAITANMSYNQQTDTGNPLDY